MKTYSALITIVAAAMFAGCSRHEAPELIKNARPGVALLMIMDAKGNETATGTGYWISEDGKLVSNYHVIKDAEKVTARAHNGATFAVSSILFEDVTNDIVILQTDGTAFYSLPLGTSASAKQGDKVIVVGSPMGLEGSASEGIVSGLRTKNGENLLQITAPISPGSSGSPVIDANGQVIGTARLTLEGGQSLNFAVPIEIVKNAVLNGLPKTGKSFSQGHTIVHLPERTLRIAKADWIPMENPADFAVNFEATAKRASQKYNQVITVFKTPMSTNRRIGSQISANEYVEIFWVWLPGKNESDPDESYLVIKLQVDKGSYWVLSRESFIIPNVSKEQSLTLARTALDVTTLRIALPFFDFENAADSTRLLIQQTF